MKHLYYIRHGESTSNVIEQVGNDDAQLTEKGIVQAIAAGRYLQTENVNPDIIISSPLDRAKDTAIYVAQEIGYDVSKIEFNIILRERWNGDLELGNIDRDTSMTTDYYFANPLSIDYIPGVEKLIDLHKRAEKIVKMAKERPENTVVLVSHGALLRSVHKVINDIPFDKAIPPFNNAKVLKLI